MAGPLERGDQHRADVAVVTSDENAQVSLLKRADCATVRRAKKTYVERTFQLGRLFCGCRLPRPAPRSRCFSR